MRMASPICYSSLSTDNAYKSQFAFDYQTNLTQTSRLVPSLYASTEDDGV